MFSKKFVALIAVFAVIGAAVFWVLSGPVGLSQVVVPPHMADLANGKVMYDAGGCISCHKPPKGKGDANLPSGGAAFVTPIGTFYPPNLTPHETSIIGKYRLSSDVETNGQREFVLAMKYGEVHLGNHYIPAFPYNSYGRMKITDLLDLLAYLKTLKPVDSSKNKQTAIFGLPIIRRGIGVWKKLGFDSTDFKPDKTKSESWNRGAYLVAGPGHCNECHTPRNIFMVSDFSRHLAGGRHPEGKGKVPSLRGLKKRKRFKNVDDLNSALRFGEIFGYEDMSSGGMGDVQSNMGKLPEADTKAIAEYLFSLE